MTIATTAVTHQLPTQAQLAQRAYQIYLERGSQAGHELDDWAQAEYELMRLPIHNIAELSPGTPSKRARNTLVALIQAAMTLGTTGRRSVR